MKKKRKLFSPSLVHRNLFNIKPTDVTVTMKVLTIKDTHTQNIHSQIQTEMFEKD